MTQWRKAPKLNLKPTNRFYRALIGSAKDKVGEEVYAHSADGLEIRFRDGSRATYLLMDLVRVEMCDLVENPVTKEVFRRHSAQVVGRVEEYIQDLSGVSFGITPDMGAETWPVVGKVPSYDEWVADPGNWGPVNAVARLSVFTGDKFTVGGNCLAVRALAEQHKTEAAWLRSFNCRNAARAAADVEV